jgi:hypothetical protein
MRQRFFVALVVVVVDELFVPNESTCDPVTSPNAIVKVFLDLASEAFISNNSRLSSLAHNVAVVVLPIPGGPLSKAAFQGPFGDENAFP